MYKIKLTAKAKKELRNLSKTKTILLAQIFEELKDDPLAGKRLKRELIGYYSLRLDVFRVIYKINSKEKIITVITAGHRSTVYR